MNKPKVTLIEKLKVIELYSCGVTSTTELSILLNYSISTITRIIDEFLKKKIYCENGFVILESKINYE